MPTVESTVIRNRPVFRYSPPLGMRAILLLTLLFVALPSTCADSIKLTSQLIWGTDGRKPDGLKCRDLEPELKRRLGRVFKWKNYYEIRRKHLEVEGHKVQKVKMSEKCVLEIREKPSELLEVKLIGEGRLTKTTRQSIQALRKGELLVLAGDAKDNTADAWFVVLSVTPEKPPKPSEKGRAVSSK